MTQEEKAKQLFERCLDLADDCGSPYPKEHAKSIFDFVVSEVISANPHSNPLNTNVHSTMDYWQEIKQEGGNYE